MEEGNRGIVKNNDKRCGDMQHMDTRHNLLNRGLGNVWLGEAKGTRMETPCWFKKRSEILAQGCPRIQYLRRHAGDEHGMMVGGLDPS
jgi:hypothetical protein